VWFTGNSYPAPITPYESELKALLDGGGRLFMSGQDILDQAAGTTSFVHDYLHIDWDGQETQNDKPTSAIHGIPSTAIGGDFGTVPLNLDPSYGHFEDQITPIAPAVAQFQDDATEDDALAVTDNNGGSDYKVVFMGFPFEAFGSATDRADAIADVQSYFAP
jgi:hypothetical protein